MNAPFSYAQGDVVFHFAGGLKKNVFENKLSGNDMCVVARQTRLVPRLVEGEPLGCCDPG